MKKISKELYLGLFLVGLVFSFQNCSDVSFSSSEKLETLSKNPVLPPDLGDGIPEPDDRPVVPPVTTPSEGELSFDITRECSTTRTESRGNSNVMAATELIVNISPAPDFLTDYKGNFDLDDLEDFNEDLKGPNEQSSPVCTNNDTSRIRAEILAGTLNLNNCSLADGSYVLDILNEEDNNMLNDIGFFTLQDGKMVGSRDFKVIVDSNPNKKDDDVLDYAGATCDKKASPLYVDFRKSPDDFDILSAPEDGVEFDILGANGQPAYSKNQISWFKKGRYAMIALPDQYGQVNGIDQLFGDNTLGPDGDFADNGFDALAKYDSNDDGRIDRNDRIYSELRLWFDRNRDGKAQRRELKTLKEKGLSYLDLDYDKNFREVDKYGNEIKYKSVAGKKNGKTRLIFDVWFAL